MRANNRRNMGILEILEDYHYFAIAEQRQPCEGIKLELKAMVTHGHGHGNNGDFVWMHFKQEREVARDTFLKGQWWVEWNSRNSDHQGHPGEQDTGVIGSGRDAMNTSQEGDSSDPLTELSGHKGRREEHKVSGLNSERLNERSSL